MKKGSYANDFPADYLEKLERLRPIDDDFMRILLRKNLPLSERILRIIMDMPDLHIISVETQADLKMIGSRSLELDVLCESDRKQLSHNHHFKWWFVQALKRANYCKPKKAVLRALLLAAAYKRLLLSSFLDSSDCSSIYFFIASSVTLPIVAT